MGEEQAELETARIFDLVDTDKSGSIDYTEFIAATMDKEKAICKQSLQMAFRVFDKDGNGKITLDEIEEVIGSQEGIDKNAWKDIAKEIDENGDGEVDFEEFEKMMKKLVKSQ